MEKHKKISLASPRQIFNFFSKSSTSRSQFVGQILNSDLASSYFPFNTPTVFVFLPVLHPNRSFEISMTIVLILQQGLSESSRSRVSLLHSAMYLSLYLCICLFFHFAFASVAGRAWNKTSFKAQFQSDIVSMKTMKILVVGRNATV